MTEQFHVLAGAAGGAEDELHRWYDDVHLPEIRTAYPEIVEAKRVRIAATPTGHTSLATYVVSGSASDLWRRLSTDRTLSRSDALDRWSVMPLLPETSAEGIAP